MDGKKGNRSSLGRRGNCLFLTEKVERKGRTFVLKVQDDGGVDGGDGEVGETAVFQLHVQCD